MLALAARSGVSLLWPQPEDASMKETTKYCGKCRQRKPVDAFNKNRATADGRQAHCRTCRKIYGDSYRAQAKDRMPAL